MNSSESSFSLPASPSTFFSETNQDLEPLSNAQNDPLDFFSTSTNTSQRILTSSSPLSSLSGSFLPTPPNAEASALVALTHKVLDHELAKRHLWTKKLIKQHVYEYMEANKSSSSSNSNPSVSICDSVVLDENFIPTPGPLSLSIDPILTEEVDKEIKSSNLEDLMGSAFFSPSVFASNLNTQFTSDAEFLIEHENKEETRSMLLQEIELKNTLKEMYNGIQQSMEVLENPSPSIVIEPLPSTIPSVNSTNIQIEVGDFSSSNHNANVPTSLSQIGISSITSLNEFLNVASESEKKTFTTSVGSTSQLNKDSSYNAASSIQTAFDIIPNLLVPSSSINTVASIGSNKVNGFSYPSLMSSIRSLKSRAETKFSYTSSSSISAKISHASIDLGPKSNTLHNPASLLSSSPPPPPPPPPPLFPSGSPSVSPPTLLSSSIPHPSPCINSLCINLANFTFSNRCTSELVLPLTSSNSSPLIRRSFSFSYPPYSSPSSFIPSKRFSHGDNRTTCPMLSHLNGFYLKVLSKESNLKVEVEEKIKVIEPIRRTKSFIPSKAFNLPSTPNYPSSFNLNSTTISRCKSFVSIGYMSPNLSNKPMLCQVEYNTYPLQKYQQSFSRLVPLKPKFAQPSPHPTSPLYRRCNSFSAKCSLYGNKDLGSIENDVRPKPLKRSFSEQSKLENPDFPALRTLSFSSTGGIYAPSTSITESIPNEGSQTSVESQITALPIISAPMRLSPMYGRFLSPPLVSSTHTSLRTIHPPSSSFLHSYSSSSISTGKAASSSLTQGPSLLLSPSLKKGPLSTSKEVFSPLAKKKRKSKLASPFFSIQKPSFLPLSTKNSFSRFPRKFSLPTSSLLPKPLPLPRGPPPSSSLSSFFSHSSGASYYEIAPTSEFSPFSYPFPFKHPSLSSFSSICSLSKRTPVNVNRSTNSLLSSLSEPPKSPNSLLVRGSKPSIATVSFSSPSSGTKSPSYSTIKGKDGSSIQIHAAMKPLFQYSPPRSFFSKSKGAPLSGLALSSVGVSSGGVVGSTYASSFPITPDKIDIKRRISETLGSYESKLEYAIWLAEVAVPNLINSRWVSMYAKETLDCFLKLTTPTLHQSNNPTRVPPHASCVGEAWYQLGEWYRLGQAEGNVQPYLAYQAFSKASKLGHLLATYRKAVCCEFSWGKKKVNEKKALRLYRICAKAGLCQAALKLGFIYLHGLCHEQIDLDSSLLWLKKAASETPPSLFSLHAGYMIGQRYEKMNHKERSFSFYLDTAQLGYPASMFQVALCYQEGKGVNKHPGLAQKWFRNAKAHGITHLAQITNLPLPT